MFYVNTDLIECPEEDSNEKADELNKAVIHAKSISGRFQSEKCIVYSLCRLCHKEHETRIKNHQRFCYTSEKKFLDCYCLTTEENYKL